MIISDNIRILMNIIFILYRQDEEEKKPKPAAPAGNKMTAPAFTGKPKDVVCCLM